MLTDDDLLDYVDPHPQLARLALQVHGDAFRHQLVMARFLDRWASEIENDNELAADWGIHPRNRVGFCDALRSIAGMAREGEFIAGGKAHDDTMQELFRE